MKIFFSYGHDDNSVIVDRIKQDIENIKDENGNPMYEVWIDYSEIKSGDDWRQSIASGILKSDFVMSFASKHSVRDPGVCLDELMIAVSVKGAQIQTVLLESNVEPPSNIGYKQYIDMKDWQSYKETPEFENWYKEKLNEILNVIQSDETKKYAEELEYLKEALSPDLSTMKKDRLQNEYYCGREWLSKKVNDWVKNDNQGNVLLLVGSPGSGKSSFMAHECLFNGTVGATIFCEWDKSNYNNIDSISRILVFQLAMKFPDYREFLLLYLQNEEKRTGSKVFKPENSDDVFKFLLVKQLRVMIDGNRDKIAILIDGIDEIQSNDSPSSRKKNRLVEMILDSKKDFPNWICFVISSRNDDTVIRPFKYAQQILIEQNEEENNSDILQYLHYQLDKKLSEKDIEKIAKLSAGNFLYANMVSRGIIEYGISLEDILKGEAGDLSSVYRKYFDRVFEDVENYENKYYPAFASLSVSKQPIPKDTFCRINNWDERDLNRAMKDLGPFLSMNRQEFSLYHKSLKDWLLCEESDDYMISKKSGFVYIAEACYKAYQEDMYAMNYYEVKYLIPLLEKTINKKRVLEIQKNVEYGNLLFEKSILEKKKFHYESALALASMALKVFTNTNDDLKRLRTYLLIAEIQDLTVNLEESIDSCKEALKIECHDSRDILEIKGDILMRLAYVYFRKTDYNNSLKNYNQAIQTYQRSGNNEKVIEALMMKGNCLRIINKTKEAIQCFLEIKKIPEFLSCKKKNPSLYSYALMNYGWVLHDQNNNRAKDVLKEAEQIIKENINIIPMKYVAHIYYLLGVEAYSEKKYDESKTLLQTALVYEKKAYGENAVEICSILNQLGAIEKKLGNIQGSLDYFKQTCQIRLNEYGKENLFTSISLRNYAASLMVTGKAEDFLEAGQILKEVYEIRNHLFKGNDGIGWRAQIALDIANYYKLEKNFEKSLERANEAEAFYRSCNEKEVRKVKEVKGMIFYNLDLKEESLQEFKEGLEISIKCNDSYYIEYFKNWIKKISE